MIADILRFLSVHPNSLSLDQPFPAQFSTTPPQSHGFLCVMPLVVFFCLNSLSRKVLLLLLLLLLLPLLLLDCFLGRNSSETCACCES